MKDEAILCTLHYGVGGLHGQHELTRGRTVIGRGSACDLVLPDPTTSTTHAEIEFYDGQWNLTDLGSRNGTHVNGIEIGTVALRHGDRIRIGGVRLRVELRTHEQAVPTVLFDDAPLPVAVARSQRLQELEADLDHSISATDPSELTVRKRSPGSALRSALRMVRLCKEASAVLFDAATLHETLERVLDLLFSSIPAEHGLVGLYDADEETFVHQVMRSRDPGEGTRVLFSTHVAAEAKRTGAAVLASDLRNDLRFDDARSVWDLNLRAAICAPLVREGRVHGLVYADTQNAAEPFTEEHLESANILASLVSVAVEKARLREGLTQARRARQRLERYHAPAVVERIVHGSDLHDGRMIAEERAISVLFADLCGFTALSESLSAQRVAATLNEVFELLTEIVFDLEGTVDKFMGDALMVFFGAPLEQPDHARRAVDAALRMQDAVAAYNKLHRDEPPLRMRIGINSGTAVVGDIGGLRRKDYTAIGDPVNVASRLETSVASPGQVVIGPATYEAVKAVHPCRALPEVVLRGRREPVRPYLVVSKRRDPTQTAETAAFEDFQ